MRVAHLVIALFAITVAACGGKPGKSVCDNQVPPPAACMTECDPSPGAVNNCPGGYHCAPDGFCDALCTPGGNECGDGYICTSDGRCKGENECTGLECDVVACTSQGKPDTTISGTVFAPNGTLPLYGIKVYVPNAPVPPFTEGAECSRCVNDDQLPGSPVNGIATQTDEAGKFTLTGVPKGQNIPLVITSGKWRRQITIANVTECTDNAAPASDTRLPKNKSEGDIPRIALSTGAADTLECLLRRIGIDDAEIGKEGSDRRVQLFTDQNSGGRGVSTIKNGFPGGGGQMSDSKGLWSDVNKLKTYDLVILSCEGGQYPETKTKADMDALKAYADVGGRVFLSHWHNVWIGGAFQSGGNPRPDVWTQVATWQNQGDPGSGSIDVIDQQNNPKGTAFATWMQNVMGSTVLGEIPIQDGTAKTTCSAVDPARGERWTYLKGTQRPQNFQFTTPNEVQPADRCGKVVFSDMHVSGNAMTGEYPDSCGDGGTPRAMTPQEKALAFMLFDLASCVSVIL
jgi:hypothetical protein